MDDVLTTAASVSCDHPLPGHDAGGAVTLTATQNVLKVGGQPVLVGSLVNALIDPTNCAQKPPPPSNQPCTGIMTQTVGASRVLKVNGSLVLLKSSAGTTNSVPPGSWSAKDAGQSVLRAD